MRVVILNPIAGRKRIPGLEKRLERAFCRHGIPCEILLTRKAGDATALAREAVQQGADLVVAAGGDGTVNEVVNGLVGTNTPLGIIPLGTVNVLARELGIPLAAHKAIKTIAEGSPKPIDVGIANGRCFTLMAGFGFDAEVVTNVLQPIKDWIGASAYILKGLETLAKCQATEITLEMPEETYSAKAFLVVVANVSTYGYNLHIAPMAAPDDGFLDICVFERPITDRIGFMRQVAEVFINRHMYHKAVRFFRTTQVTLRSEPEVFVHLDGDPFGKTPVEISIRPQILPVIRPLTIDHRPLTIDLKKSPGRGDSGAFRGERDARSVWYSSY